MGECGKDHIVCLELDDGEVWRTPIGSGGDPNCTPTVDGDLVFALGPMAIWSAARREDGTVVWRKNLSKDFGGR